MNTRELFGGIRNNKKDFIRAICVECEKENLEKRDWRNEKIRIKKQRQNSAIFSL